MANINVSDDVDAFLQAADKNAARETLDVFLDWLFKTADYTANVYEKIKGDTSGGPFTVTLPPTPTIGQWIKLSDAKGTWATNNLTIARNGKNINGAAGNYTANVNDANLILVFKDNTLGWSIN